MLICWGKMLDGSPAEIEVTDAQAAEFRQAKTYQAKLGILRGAAFRARMVSMLLTAEGKIVTNLEALEPGRDEDLVWLQAGQHYETLDRQHGGIVLGPEAVRLFTAPRRGKRRDRNRSRVKIDAQTL